MTRVRSLLVVVMPTLLVGGLVFRNSFGHAAAGTDEGRGNWPAASGVLVADNSRPRRNTPPAPPTPPGGWGDSMPPAPPAPPVPPVASRGRHGGSGVSVSIHNGQIQIDGIDELVNGHLEAVRQMLRNNPNLPKDVRDRISARMDRVKAIVDRRLKNLKATDIDKLGDEMDKMGEELEQALQGLDADLSTIGDQVGKDLAKELKKLKKLKLDGNEPDEPDEPDPTDETDETDTSSIDEDGAIEDLRGMTLKPAQRDQIAKLRVDSETRVASAQKALDESSKRLETALADPQTSDAEVVRLVDQVSGHEAAIRKARLLAWIGARRVLDAEQVKRIESAAHKNHR